jgi:SAM-dependent methyltransferase
MHEEDFIKIASKMENVTVLDLGSKRSVPDRPTHHRSWCHESVKFIMSDFQDGADVDVVADIHTLSKSFSRDSIDLVISCSVFEHVQRPWIAAHEIARVLKPGGLLYVQTHQSFPIHGYPSDYYRFTKEALSTIFEDVKLETISTTYKYPAQVVSEQDPGGKFAPAFLNVNILSKKPTNWKDFASADEMREILSSRSKMAYYLSLLMHTKP